MEKVLFLCVHNSARSQMAEAYLKRFGSDEFEALSAGFEPTEINPLVIEAMAEEGVDLSTKSARSAFDIFQRGELFGYVITVCEESVDKDCPVFPGLTQRIHMPFPDPAKVQGTHEEQLAQVRAIRDSIKDAVQALVVRVRAGDDGPL